MVKSLSYTFITVLAVDLLATSGDITLSWTSPIYPQLYSNDTLVNPLGKPISEAEDGWIGSLVTIGAVIGPLPFSFIGERLGRRIGLLCIALPHIASYLILALAKNVYMFYIGRFLGGIAMGGGYSLLPMYIAEISKDSNRGMMSQTMNVFWSVGTFIPYAIGPFMSIFSFNIILACIPATFFIIFLLIGPETPYYLLLSNKTVEAERSLMMLRSRSKQEIQKELEHIKGNLKNEKQGKFLDIFRRRELRKAFIICMVLIIAQEISGFCAISFYLQPIFEATGTPISSEISAVIVGFSMLVTSFVAPLLVDKLGRRFLTIYSCLGMFLSLSLLGTFFYIQNSTNLSTASIYWVPIFSLIFYIFSYNFGISSVPWTLCSELFPSNYKQLSSSVISSTCWLTSFLVTKFFNDMNNSLGRAGTFWFFAAACLLAAIFSVICVPETKGKSFNEIQDMLKYK